MTRLTAYFVAAHLTDRQSTARLAVAGGAFWAAFAVVGYFAWRWING